MTRDALVVMALALALFASALFKVWIVHVNRTTFTAVQAAHATRDEMNVEWGRLQIEQAAWSTHARIEQIVIPPDPGCVTCGSGRARATQPAAAATSA